MVKLKALDKEISHLTKLIVGNPNIAIGVIGATSHTEFEMFDKSDILINKIEKLPVMLSAKLTIECNAVLGESLVAAAIETIAVRVILFNANEANEAVENIIYQNEFIVNVVGTQSFDIFIPDQAEENFVELLTDTLSFQFGITCNDAAGGAALAPDSIYAVLMTEINWIKVSEAELKEYALEHLYVNM
jgi:hypothetical protein